jgi:DNA-binding transcriptional regulator YhcF (GntR family)
METGDLFDESGKELRVVEPASPAKGRPFQGWAQSDLASHDQMWRLNLKNHVAVSVLHYMIARMARDSSGFVASAATLSAELGVSPRTIQTAVQVLKQYNFVQILKSGNTNVYVINSQVAWRGMRGMRNATFNATITVNEKEQENTVEELEEENSKLLSVPDMSAFFSGEVLDVVTNQEGSTPKED